TTINANPTASGVVTAAANSPSSGQVTVTANTSGAAGNSIGTTKTITNFTWAGGTTTLAGGVNGQPSIVGFNNLYVNAGGTVLCSGLTAPKVAWAYRTTLSPIATSPVISFLPPNSGTKVAYVESSSPPKLHVL